MSDTPHSADWWFGDDGKWYPPEQWTGPPGTSPPVNAAFEAPKVETPSDPTPSDQQPPQPDQPPAPGYWKASDGNWYPPQPPQTQPSSFPQPPPAASPKSGMPGWAKGCLLSAGLVAVLGVLGIACIAVVGNNAVDEIDSAIEDTTSTVAADTTEPGATESEPAAPAAVDASPYVTGFGDLSAVSLPDGEPGQVSIIWSGTAINRRGSVTMIVRNNTSEDIGSINVTGTARDAAGTLVGSGSSQGFSPAYVAPGEIAYGYVYFDTELAGQTFTFGFEVDAETVAGAIASRLPVTVTEINNTGDQFVGVATNELDKDVSGPIGAAVLCFDAGGSVIDYTDGYLEQNDLAPGATGSFSIDLFGKPCPNGIVSASGYGF